MLRKLFHLQVSSISSKTILGSGASKTWLRLCGGHPSIVSESRVVWIQSANLALEVPGQFAIELARQKDFTTTAGSCCSESVD
jgi:hypothetical protein